MEKIIDKLDSEIMSSSHINFLFGAGVNGRAFPQLENFVQTKDLYEKKMGKKMENFEQDLDDIGDKAKIKAIHKQFLKEFGDFAEKLDYGHKDIIDIENMFYQVNLLVSRAENRTITMKQVNIYTLNYDEIVEHTLDKIGVLNNSVSSTNIMNNDKFFEMVGYDYGSRKYVPTYLVSKIHGDIKNPILPGKNKYDQSLEAKRFEILFKMKTQLSRINSALVVIGYSGRDNHINTLLKDCVISGLTIYWIRFSNDQKLPEELEKHAFVIDQKDQNFKENSTKIFTDMLRELWDTKSEK